MPTSPTLSIIGEDLVHFKFKFVKQSHVPMVVATNGAGPAFHEASLQNIIECCTPLDNLSETQSRKLTFAHKWHGTWMYPNQAGIRLGSGGAQHMSNFVFDQELQRNAHGNQMATFKCITKKSRYYEMIVVVIAEATVAPSKTRASFLPQKRDVTTMLGEAMLQSGATEQ